MSEVSKSKQKRMDQKHQRNIQHKKKAAAAFWKIFIPLLIIAAIAGAVYLYQDSKLNYSKYLNADGTIKNVKASEYVTVNDENISFTKAELLPDDSAIDSEIDSDLSKNMYLSDDPGLLSSYGDKLSITYTSTVDGNEYKNADTATDYTIGDETYGSEFDNALEDHGPGEDINVSVTFEDDYEDETVAGKTAEFNIHIEGIYQEREFDDMYVQEFHSDVASTADEYRQSLIKSHYQENLENAIERSLSENSVVSKLPTAYIKNLARVISNQQRTYMLQMYQMFGMEAPSGETWEIMGQSSKEEYDAEISRQAEEETAKSLELQYLFDKYGMSISEADVRSYFASQEGYDEAAFNEMVSENGIGFYAQQYLKKAVIDRLKETVKITE